MAITKVENMRRASCRLRICLLALKYIENFFELVKDEDQRLGIHFLSFL